MQEKKSNSSSFLFGLVLAILALAAAPILIRYAGEAKAAPLSFWRLFVGTLVWSLFSWFQRKREKANPCFAPGTKRLAWLAGAFLALHYLTWALAVSMTTVSQAAFLLLVQPLMTGIAAHYLLRERLHRFNVLALIMTLVGAWILCSDDFTSGSLHLKGDILAGVAAFFNMAYLLTGRFVRRSNPSYTGLPLYRYLPLLYGSAMLFSLLKGLMNR